MKNLNYNYRPTKFEQYNQSLNGYIFMVQPGIINPKTAIDLSLPVLGKSNHFILLPNYIVNQSEDLFRDICLSLVKQGYLVLIEYSDKGYSTLRKYEIDFIGIYTSIYNLEKFAENLQLDYITNDIYNEWYQDIEQMRKIVDNLSHLNYTLELRYTKFNLKQAIDSYLYDNTNRYQF